MPGALPASTRVIRNCTRIFQLCLQNQRLSAKGFRRIVCVRCSAGGVKCHPGVPGGAAAAMKKYIGCDMHKKYSVFVTMDETGYLQPAVRISNDLLELRAHLEKLPRGAP